VSDAGRVRVRPAGETRGDESDLTWALDTDGTAIDTFTASMEAGTFLDRHAHTVALAARILGGRLSLAFDDGDVIDLGEGDVLGLPAGLIHTETVPADGDVAFEVGHQGPFGTYEP
jgi:quercetin dioxygenase-like cupin family protein